jgi:hypothetical protein
VTTYSYDPDLRQLVAAWAQGTGARARVLAELPQDTSPDSAYRLCEFLTRLSTQLWSTYRLVPAAMTDEDERRTAQSEWDARTEVLHFVEHPGTAIPLDKLFGITPFESFSWETMLVQLAKQVGQGLQQLDLADVREAVLDDISSEIDAVERAEAGELEHFRANHAITLDRIDSNPTQVAIADHALRELPLAIVSKCEATSASVADAHWFAAALQVAAVAADKDPVSILEENFNDDDPTSVTTFYVATAILVDDLTPHDIVVTLINQALACGDGLIPDAKDLLTHVDHARALASAAPKSERDEILSANLPTSLTSLDTRHPGSSMLVHLFKGKLAAWEEFTLHMPGDRTGWPVDPHGKRLPECTDPGVFRLAKDFANDDPDGIEGYAATLGYFLDLVRAEAASTADRLFPKEKSLGRRHLRVIK